VKSSMLSVMYVLIGRSQESEFRIFNAIADYADIYGYSGSCLLTPDSYFPSTSACTFTGRPNR